MTKLDPNKEPSGDLAIRTLAMPANTNPNGDIFGGWVVSQMDLAGLSIIQKLSCGRATTVAIDSMVFMSPVKVGDFICCYGDILRIGRTSVAVKIETWAISIETGCRHQVTEGVFTYVAIDNNGRPRLVTPTATSQES